MRFPIVTPIVICLTPPFLSPISTVIAATENRIGIEALRSSISIGHGVTARLCSDDVSIGNVNGDIAARRGPGTMKRRIVALIVVCLAPFFLLAPEIILAAIIAAATR